MFHFSKRSTRKKMTTMSLDEPPFHNTMLLKSSPIWRILLYKCYYPPVIDMTLKKTYTITTAGMSK